MAANSAGAQGAPEVPYPPSRPAVVRPTTRLIDQRKPRAAERAGRTKAEAVGTGRPAGPTEPTDGWLDEVIAQLDEALARMAARRMT